MTKPEILLAEIKRHNSAYRTGNPIISDADYDKKVEELRRMDPDNEWFKSAEPAPVAQDRKVKLPIPMKSLDKAKSLSEVLQWIQSLGLKEQRLVVTPKFDGISLLYDQKTQQAFSRGGAENEGQDCTDYAAKVCGIARNSLIPEIHYTYGELVFRVNAWEAYFMGRVSPYSGNPYKSPRNTIAGFINRDAPDDELKYATFFRYGVDEASLAEFHSYDELYRYLSSKFDMPLLKKAVLASELTEDFLKGCFDEWSKEFYIDGLVIYIDDLELWKMIGRHQTTGNPKYAIAYKNPEFTPTFESGVKSVSWKISKSGALKPVVNIDTVYTGDCAMENPTGYNAKYIFENGIGPGAVVKVTRSGGVIPKILEVIEEATSEAMIEQRDDLMYCPHCGRPTSWNDSKVELVCKNQDCPGVRLAKICHFYETLGAEQMGEETISKMFKAGIDSVRKALDVTFEDLLTIESFGEGIANSILSANNKIKEGVEITKLMHASDCFQGIGQTKAKSILSQLDPTFLLSFINGYAQTQKGFEKEQAFKSLSKTMQSFVCGIQPFYDFLAETGLVALPMEQEPETKGIACKGMKVCFTGIRDKKLESEITAQGGLVVSGVSKQTTHLIVGSHDSVSTKTIKAKSLNIPIYTLSEFKQLIQL